MNLWEMVTGIYSCLTQPHTQHQWDGRGECKQPPSVIPSSAVPEKSHRCISADWGVTKTLFWNNLNCLYSSLQPTVYLFPFQLTILYSVSCTVLDEQVKLLVPPSFQTVQEEASECPHSSAIAYTKDYTDAQFPQLFPFQKTNPTLRNFAWGTEDCG